MKDILIPAGLAGGDRTKNILIRPDRKFPGHIFLRTPHPGRLSLTPEQAIELANTIADILEGETMTTNTPDHNPLAVSFVEMAAAIRMSTDHIRTKTPGPMPTPTYSHPEQAAATATHALAILAMHYYTDWDHLYAWLEDISNEGLDKLNLPIRTTEENQ